MLEHGKSNKDLYNMTVLHTTEILIGSKSEGFE